jgi:hypothetical protein
MNEDPKRSDVTSGVCTSVVSDVQSKDIFRRDAVLADALPGLAAAEQAAERATLDLQGIQRSYPRPTSERLIFSSNK